MKVREDHGEHVVTLTTDDRARELAIAPKAGLALATCYCNDLYREARKRGIEVHRVEVEVEGSQASRQEIIDVMRHTDSVAEIQNTLRRSCPVLPTGTEAHEAVN